MRFFCPSIESAYSWLNQSPDSDTIGLFFRVGQISVTPVFDPISFELTLQLDLYLLHCTNEEITVVDTKVLNSHKLS